MAMLMFYISVVWENNFFVYVSAKFIERIYMISIHQTFPILFFLDFSNTQEYSTYSIIIYSRIPIIAIIIITNKYPLHIECRNFKHRHFPIEILFRCNWKFHAINSPTIIGRICIYCKIGFQQAPQQAQFQTPVPISHLFLYFFVYLS